MIYFILGQNPVNKNNSKKWRDWCYSSLIKIFIPLGNIMSLWTPIEHDYMDVIPKTAPAKSAKLLPFVSTRPSDTVSSGVKAGRICSACTVGIPWRFLALRRFLNMMVTSILGWWNTIQKSSSHQYPFIILCKSPFWWIFNPWDIHGILMSYLIKKDAPST